MPAERRYRARTFSGPAVVVTAPSDPVGRSEWAAVLREPVGSTEVRSEHCAMLREPHAHGIGALLLAASASGGAHPLAGRGADRAAAAP